MRRKQFTFYDFHRSDLVSILISLLGNATDRRTRSHDGLTLLMSSSDGYCSSIAFAPGELGQVYSGQAPTAHHPNLSISISGSSQPSPVPTPTAASAASPVKPHPSSILAPSPSSAAAARPVSPSRSNSNSSIATQSSFMQTPAGIIASNPTPTIGNVPSVAATNSAPAGLPLCTPPMTPMSTVSAPSSVSGSLLGKRDIGGTSESEMEDNKSVLKKRRIAPTLVKEDDLPAGA